MLYSKITMDERNHDLWMKEDQQYAIILMYSVNESSEPRFISGGPFKPSTVLKRLEDMLNDAEQERFVCINSHFINSKNIICVKVDRWKDKNARVNFDGEFYE